MFTPISIKSTIQFVIIGPIKGGDGIIIYSENLTSDLLGFARDFYYSDNRQFLNKINFNKFKNKKYQCILHNSMIKDENGRESTIMLCYKIESDSLDISLSALSFTEKALSDFILNTRWVFASAIKGTDTNYNENGYKEKIWWSISSLLYECANLQDRY